MEILRRVASAPVAVSASIARAGSRMRAVDATMTQHGEPVARASALYLRRGIQPDGNFFTTAITVPPLPAEPPRFDDSVPMFIQAYGQSPEDGDGFPWQHPGPRVATGSTALFDTSGPIGSGLSTAIANFGFDRGRSKQDASRRRD